MSAQDPIDANQGDADRGAAERILAEAGNRRPSVGSIRCPYCGRGDLFFCIGKDERVSISCSDCPAELHHVAIGHLPPMPRSWAAASAPND